MSSSDTLSPVLVILEEGRGYASFIHPLDDVPALMREGGLPPNRCFVVTDENVAALHLDTLLTALNGAEYEPSIHIIPPGEASKSRAILRSLSDEILEDEVDRTTPILALGGGVVGDLAGFAAATLLRGLPLVHLPTTLVAQVDSSIGGKTGINHPTGKNLIGSFYQPNLVVADPATLQTLDKRDWTSGLAEVVKHALIADPSLLDFLRDNWSAILEQNASVVPELIQRAAHVKAKIVAADEHEQGRRAILNFGHTFGHAIEHAAGYGTFTHGEAVAVGMRAAVFLSHERNPDFDVDATHAFVRRLPVAGDPARLRFKDLRRAMNRDKKNKGDAVRFVLLREPGTAYVADGFSDEILEAAWQFAIQPANPS